MNRRIIIGVLAALCLAGCGQKSDGAGSQKNGSQITGSQIAGSQKNGSQITGTTDRIADSGIREAAKPEETAAQGVDDNFRDHFFEVKIDGVGIVIPSGCETLSGQGLHILRADNDIVGFNSAVVATCIWKENTENFLTLKFRFSGEDKNRNIRECDGVYFSWNIDAAKDLDVEFYGGLKAGSSREEAAAFLEEVYADESGAEYSLYLDDSEQSGMMAYFNGDELSTVEIRNYEGYIQ